MWQASKDYDGYGKFSVKSRIRNAHRVAWASYHRRAIPTGLQLDHRVCSNPSCVNPLHLEPVSSRENTSRGHAVKRQFTKASRFTGVHQHPGSSHYQARIRINGREIHISTYKTEREAADAYQSVLSQITNGELSREQLNDPSWHFSWVVRVLPHQRCCTNFLRRDRCTAVQ